MTTARRFVLGFWCGFVFAYGTALMVYEAWEMTR